MNMNENALIEKKEFIVPSLGETECEFSNEDFAEDFEGLQLSFPRIKIPGSGSLRFEMPSANPEDPEYEKTIDGVIIYNHRTCAYWPAGSEYDESVNPLCSSVDGKTGIGDPGGACAVCELNQYGTATDKNGNATAGKACKNMRHLYILRSGEYLPVMLSLPPTSIRPYSDFMNTAFVPRKRPTWSSVIQIGLKRVENGANTYSVATFKVLYDLEGEQLRQVKQYAESFRGQIRRMLQERALSSESRLETDVIADPDPNYMISENGEHFSVTANVGVGTVDGERNELPLA